MGLAEHWHNQLVRARAVLNKNGAIEVLAVESFSGLMDLMPRQEGQGEVGQIDGQVDSQSVWHMKVGATLMPQHPWKHGAE